MTKSQQRGEGGGGQKDRRGSVYLLNFGGGAFKELYIAASHTVAVFLESFIGLLVSGKHDKGITGGAAVGIVDEENPLLSVQDGARDGLPRKEF